MRGATCHSDRSIRGVSEQPVTMSMQQTPCFSTRLQLSPDHEPRHHMNLASPCARHSHDIAMSQRLQHGVILESSVHSATQHRQRANQQQNPHPNRQPAARRHTDPPHVPAPRWQTQRNPTEKAGEQISRPVCRALLVAISVLCLSPPSSTTQPSTRRVLSQNTSTHVLAETLRLEWA